MFGAQAELSRPAALRWGRRRAVCVSRGEPCTPHGAHGEAPRALHAAGAAREPACDAGGAVAGRAGVGVRYPGSSGSDRRRSREPRSVTWLIKESFNMTVPQTLRTCTDRKSTRLNSSHVAISYAVFCLKKKNKNV